MQLTTPVPRRRRFRIGVAVLRTLPVAETDQESLEMFGTSVMDIWDMGVHDGGLEGKRDGIGNICPDSALLVTESARACVCYTVPVVGML